jgi:Bacterial PH domain
LEAVLFANCSDACSDFFLIGLARLFRGTNYGRTQAKRGKRKGESSTTAMSIKPSKASLAPEQVYYEGPPAITETLVPTLSIVTVVGIIPAAAAWARQAWVRYKITNRRIRVTSGINGADMAEIVYPDIVEIRTVRRLLGDGDMVAFLRDGAKFEMRNIPNFLETMEFILSHVDEAVVTEYRSKGQVG